MNRTARLGAFILFTLAILLAGIFVIGSKRYLFKPTYELKAQFANVVGLQQGADVMVGGLHAGTVKAIDLPDNPGGKLTVTMVMDEPTRRIVRRNSEASIETEGLLGNQYVAVSFGATDQPEVKSGDTIASVPPLQMSELVAKANGLLGEGQAAMKNINQVSEHLKSVSAKIDQGQGTVGALINDRSIYNNFDQTAKKADATVASAQVGVKDFQDNMEALKHNFLLRGYFKNRGYEDSADLGKDAIANAPTGSPAKEFDYDAKDLFDKKDTARLKGQKKLKDAGEYLASNDFGVAVIEISTGSTGSSDADMTLAEGRALALRDYIVQHYGFDDTKLKTLSLGKQTDQASKSGWGEVKIVIYAVGTAMPPDQNPDKSQQGSTPSSSQ